MITYLYWLLVAVAIFLALFGLGVRMGRWKPALITAVVIWLASTLLYYFWLEQIFVKRFGGTMSVSVEEGYQHIAATWKGDNLWVEDYDPQNNRCVFREYSRSGALEGRVIIKNCNPLRAGQAPRPPEAQGEGP